MLALEDWRAEHVCPLCGGPREVCQAPYGTYVYGTEPPVRCMVTDAIDTAHSAWKDSPNPRALLHRPKVVPWGTPL